VALAALVQGLSDAEPLVRGACAWALGEYIQRGVDFEQARCALQARRSAEVDATVRDEIAAALGGN
jgi:HEAT repeat protein